MNLPLPTGSGMIGKQLRMVREEIRRLKPQRSANVLTQHTSTGTTRRAVASGDGSNKKVAARWS